MTTLNELKIGQKGIIDQINSKCSEFKRLLEMGMTPGTTVEVLRAAPLGDPIEIKVRGYNLAIRKAEAAKIKVKLLDECV